MAIIDNGIIMADCGLVFWLSLVVCFSTRIFFYKKLVKGPSTECLLILLNFQY